MMFGNQQPPPPQGQWQQPYPQQPPKPHRPAWEYKVVTKLRNPESELNQLGREGWELVAIDPDPHTSVTGRASRYILKRIAG
ncbi:DUF4177 domain-containing protein [Streptomonospora wellingtoniae]|uniref:DUF4177 domain-containing protein n=1 Tax=Streptomonospora wellingtoniae TaxID=3075544 RepID=A0ABU2KUE3_9ACTN|nr:DUF4177 domain-containing protein [Streptomonospora sp. DSM 45055]MDT0302916.1 DUF4177 domain-containing protein [Streptomonospora sp. DSM 45055]